MVWPLSGPYISATKGLMDLSDEHRAALGLATVDLMGLLSLEGLSDKELVDLSFLDQAAS